MPTTARRSAASGRRFSLSSRLVATLLTTLLGSVPAVSVKAQDEGEPEMNAATAREQYEAAFAAALEAPEDAEPMNVVMMWSAVLESAFIADHLRQMAAGAEPTADPKPVIDAVLERLRSLRPDSPLPDLLPLLQVRDAKTRSESLLALQERHPDDELLLEMTTQSLRQAGDEERAAALTETFLGGQPASSTAYRILASLAAGNATRHAEILRRWATAVPGDPGLVETWLEADLASLDPETTARLFGELFERRPDGFEGLHACQAVLESGTPASGMPLAPVWRGWRRTPISRSR